MSQSQPLPARPRCILPLPFVESDVDDATIAMEEAENIENLLNEYSKERKQPQKKYKVSVEDMDVENETEARDIECSSPPPKGTTSSRNPFKKEPNVSDNLHSPTRITSANSSLIKNQSPVKAIDYGRLTKLSRFNRTEIPQTQQNVTSRFFVGPPDNATNHDKDKSADANVPAIVQSEIEVKTEDLDILRSKDTGAACSLYLTMSGDSAISMGVGIGSSSVRDTASEDGEIDAINKKTDIITSNSSDAAIVLSDTDDTTEESASSQPKIAPAPLRNGVVSITVIHHAVHHLDSELTTSCHFFSRRKVSAVNQVYR